MKTACPATLLLAQLTMGILASLHAANAVGADESTSIDLLLKGGTIIDGSGSPGVVGDVAIRGDKIVGVGKFNFSQIDKTVDCSGLIVAPGFIDLHTHSDEQVVSRTMRGCVNYLLQGCTTSVTGNCGSGPVDVGDYYRKIDEGGAGNNIAHLIPQGYVRLAVIGNIDRRVTDEEKARMCELARKGMTDGAWGMTSGLIYVPSVYADTAELVDLAKVIGTHGGIYASHIRGEGHNLLTAINEALTIGKEAKCAVHVSHIKASGAENWGHIRQAAAMIETARTAGQIVTADQYPYVASSTSLEPTLFPSWARSGGSKGLLEKLADPETAAKIKADVQKSLDSTNDGDNVVISRFRPKQAWVGKSVKQIAISERKTPFDIACEIARGGDAGVVNFSMSEDDVRFAMQLPWVATASDGRSYLPGADRPHPRSYGTFARKIGYYAIKEKLLSLEQAVHTSTGLPADIIGFTDRGYLKPGLAADVVVFDPHQFIDTATYENPHRYATGVKFVLVNGTPAVHEGVPTGALAGKALRKPTK